jgi:hypothetical protein
VATTEKTAAMVGAGASIISAAAASSATRAGGAASTKRTRRTAGRRCRRARESSGDSGCSPGSTRWKAPRNRTSGRSGTCAVQSRQRAPL